MVPKKNVETGLSRRSGEETHRNRFQKGGLGGMEKKSKEANQKRFSYFRCQQGRIKVDCL